MILAFWIKLSEKDKRRLEKIDRIEIISDKHSDEPLNAYRGGELIA